MDMEDVHDQAPTDSTYVPAASTADDAIEDPDFSFFDSISILDPRVLELCAATSKPSPFAILRTCLLWNYTARHRHINIKVKKLKYQKIELTMRVGKHTAIVVSKYKKIAKQRASQAMLQSLNPHIWSWGSLLRRYGSRSANSYRAHLEQSAALQRDKRHCNKTNSLVVLNKLRQEMQKMKAEDAAAAVAAVPTSAFYTDSLTTK